MKATFCLTLALSLGVAIAIGSQLHAQIPNLENHYTFDVRDNPELDSSGNDRHGTIDDFAGFIEWVQDDDPARGGVLELEGGNQGFFFAEVPELPEDGFTVAFWAYRNPDTAGASNDGLFQVQDGGETPTTNPPNKVIGAWVGGNSDVWGRVNQANGQTMNLDRDIAYILDEEWTHLAYRGDGSTFEVFINADNSDGLSVGYDGVLKPHDTLFVGKQGNESWGGRLDDFRIYSRALTDEEIATVMTGDIGGPVLQAGDADQDLDFDQLDLVQVQIAAKYLTGQAATWGEGDWDAAPGGSPGDPPPGDNQFNQLDIIAALSAGKYLTGPYAALSDGPSVAGDSQTSIVYNPSTGEVRVDAPAENELTSINIDSAAGIFTGDPAQNLGGSFDNDADDNVFKATFGSSFGSLSFGNVAQPGLEEQFLLSDLTVVGSLAGGGALGDVDLIYVPEPSGLLLLVIGVLGVALGRPGVCVVESSFQETEVYGATRSGT